MADGNFVSPAFSQLPVSGFRLQAANEATMQYHGNAQPEPAVVSFSNSRTQGFRDADGVLVPSLPNWFVRSSAYPDGLVIGAARFGFNFTENPGAPTAPHICGARWGWAANQIGDHAAGTHDACGGLAGWGWQYGSPHMNNNKGAWDPATLYLWGR